MNVDNVAKTIKMMAEVPGSAGAQEMTIMANQMPYVGRG